MRILAIETSGLHGSIALSHQGEVIDRSLATQGRRHAQTLTLEIQELLKTAGSSPRQLDAVAVSLGPGSFTGLRVGLVCAKTLAYALGCRLIGVETYLSIAWASPPHFPESHFPEQQAVSQAGQRCWVVGDAQRGDFFVAQFARIPTRQGWQREGEYAIEAGEAWLEQRSEQDVVLGPGLLRYPETTSKAMLIREAWSVQPAATAILEVAAARFESGDFADPWTLGPIYLRPSAAEEQKTITSRARPKP